MFDRDVRDLRKSSGSQLRSTFKCEFPHRLQPWSQILSLASAHIWRKVIGEPRGRLHTRLLSELFDSLLRESFLMTMFYEI